MVEGVEMSDIKRHHLESEGVESIAERVDMERFQWKVFTMDMLDNI